MSCCATNVRCGKLCHRFTQLDYWQFIFTLDCLRRSCCLPAHFPNHTPQFLFIVCFKQVVYIFLSIVFETNKKEYDRYVLPYHQNTAGLMQCLFYIGAHASALEVQFLNNLGTFCIIVLFVLQKYADGLWYWFFVGLIA